MNGYTLHRNVIAKLRIDSPEGRVNDFHSLNLHILAAQRLNEWRTEKASLQRVYIIFVRFGVQCFRIIGLVPHGLVFIDVSHTVVLQVNHDTEKLHPPFFALTIESTFSFYGNILGIYRINKRRKTLHHHPFVTHFHKRKVLVEIIGKEQCGTGFQLQRDVTFHHDRTCEVATRGEKQRTTATLAKPVDGLVNQPGIERSTIRFGTCHTHVNTFCTHSKRQTDQ